MKRFALFTLIMASASAATRLSQPDDEAAGEAAIQWLELVDAGRNDEAASQGSQEVRSFEQWLNHFKIQRLALGRINKRHLVELKHSAIISGLPEVRRYFILRLKSSFERKPTAIEEITISKVGCCWEVFDYKISDQ